MEGLKDQNQGDSWPDSDLDTLGKCPSSLEFLAELSGYQLEDWAPHWLPVARGKLSSSRSLCRLCRWPRLPSKSMTACQVFLMLQISLIPPSILGQETAAFRVSHNGSGSAWIISLLLWNKTLPWEQHDHIYSFHPYSKGRRSYKEKGHGDHS